MKPLFYTSKTITPKDRSQIVCIRTGIKELDKRIIGLNKKEVSIVSGVNGSGKSSVISQIALEVVQCGRKVAIFSGELSEHRTLEWLQLQAAGKNNTNATQYENYYFVKPEIKKEINEWLDGKLYIYNNEYGNKIDSVLRSIEDCIQYKKCDLVVLDNLMSLDITSLSREKLEREKVLILKVMELAKNGNVHILLVAHPRKAQGFIRKDDISGSGDLTNAVDNVFIIHRVNNDFRRLSKEYFGAKVSEALCWNGNVIEVCKNRDLGVQDFFAGLYFEKESKRFLNNLEEIKKYDWEKNLDIPEEHRQILLEDDGELPPFDLE